MAAKYTLRIDRDDGTSALVELNRSQEMNTLVSGQIVHNIRHGKHIHAVKLLKEFTHSNLLAAKTAVDIMRDMDVEFNKKLAEERANINWLADERGKVIDNLQETLSAVEAENKSLESTIQGQNAEIQEKRDIIQDQCDEIRSQGEQQQGLEAARQELQSKCAGYEATMDLQRKSLDHANNLLQERVNEALANEQKIKVQDQQIQDHCAEIIKLNRLLQERR